MNAIRPVPSLATSQPFILPVPADFEGIAGEQKLGYSVATGFPVNLLSVTTNLSTCRVQIVGRRQELWSDEFIAVQSLAGRADKTNIYLPIFAPYRMGSRDILQGNFVNPSGEAAGALYFWGERGDSERVVKNLEYPTPYMAQVTPTVTSTRPKTRQIDQNFVVFGAFFEPALAGTQVLISDSFSNQNWSADFVPIEAVAGNRSNNTPQLYFPKPFLLPKNAQLIVQFSGVSTSAQFTFFGILAPDAE